MLWRITYGTVACTLESTKCQEPGLAAVLVASMHAVDISRTEGCALSGCGSVALFVTDNQGGLLISTQDGSLIQRVPPHIDVEVRNLIAPCVCECLQHSRFQTSIAVLQPVTAGSMFWDVYYNALGFRLGLLQHLASFDLRFA